MSLEGRRLKRCGTGDRPQSQEARIRARKLWAIVWGLATMTGTVCLGANGQGAKESSQPLNPPGEGSWPCVHLVSMRRKAPEHLQVTS